jgi:hypothetical protein
LWTNQIILSYRGLTVRTKHLLTVGTFVAASRNWFLAGRANDWLWTHLDAAARAIFFANFQTDLAGRANAVAARRAITGCRIKMSAAIRTSHNAHHSAFGQKGVQYAGCLALTHYYGRLTIRALTHPRQQDGMAAAAKSREQRVAVRANISPGRQFKLAGWTVKKQRGLAVGANIVLIINQLAAAAAQSSFTFRAKAILDEKRRFTNRAVAGEFVFLFGVRGWSKNGRFCFIIPL